MTSSTLYVGASQASLDILIFVDEKLDEINGKGLKIVAKHVDKKDNNMSSKLRDLGISRVPALRVDGRNYQGASKVREYIDKLLVGKAPVGKPPTLGAMDDPMSDYWNDELFEFNGGKFVPRKDDDEDNGEKDKKSMEDRMRRMQESKPYHRGGNRGEVEARQPRQTRDEQREDPLDNILQENEMEKYKTGSDDVDGRMLDALLERNG